MLCCYVMASRHRSYAYVFVPDRFCGMTANLLKGEGTLLGTIRLQKHSRRNVQNGQSNNKREAELEDNGSNNHRIEANEDRPKRGRIVFTNVLSAEKFKGSEPGFLLPPTSIAAHAVDDVLETNEVKDLDLVGTAATTIEKGSKYWIQVLPFLPPPPQVPQNAHSQYRVLPSLWGQQRETKVFAAMRGGEREVKSKAEGEGGGSVVALVQGWELAGWQWLAVAGIGLG
ncbi:hypothetical protein Acr_12g0003940 [Actinidia rufa]|uniref:Uncharacterized protein n=1 Tax=Actinidia rufa TaxID=165716 RepID=A0A7J0FGZ0_9ERIC|nr:hypothetical protein Acr_12g0003940 [Actinidia rufa]